MKYWLNELTNYEDDNVEIYFYSLNEESLTIQSSFFFLSKIGTRVRKIIFPRDLNDLTKDTDVIITANKKIVDFLDGNDKVYSILINNNTNSECKEKVNANYDSLSDVIKDEKLLNTLHEFVLNKEDNEN